MAGFHQVKKSVSSTSASSSSNLSNSQDELLNCGPPELLSPSFVFADALMSQIKTDDIQDMVQTQREMLIRFEKTNEMLLNFNMLSASRYNSGAQEFRQHTQLLYQMKKDLDVIFKRIRSLNQRLGKLYPGAFSACSNVYDWVHADDEELLTPSRNSQVASIQSPNSQTPNSQTPNSQASNSRQPSSQASSSQMLSPQMPSSQASS